MPLGEKLGRPFELLSLIGRKRKDEPESTACGFSSGNYSHPSSHQPSSTGSSYYPEIKYERLTPAAAPIKYERLTPAAPAIKYERLTPAAPAIKYERLTPGSGVASAPAARLIPSDSLDYEAAAREAAFPSPNVVPQATLTSTSFRSAPSPGLSSLPSPGMLTPLTPAVGVPSASVGRSPVIDTIRPLHPLRPDRNVPNSTQSQSNPTVAPSAPFSSVMEEWMSQLRTPTPDVTLLPSPFDFNKDTPTPMDTNSMDMQRLQDALLPTPPPDIHDQRQYPKTSAYVTTRGPRPLLEDIASLCRDLNSQDLSSTYTGLKTEMDTTYTTFPARPQRTREESIGSAYSDDGETQAKFMAAAALSSVSMGTNQTMNFSTKGKRRKMCTAEGCQNLSRSRGLCKAHGGGRRCSVEGCSRASQSGSLCITHGGGKRCTVDGCVKAAQSRGMCKAHGGGVRCRIDGCSKSSQGDGFCRSHGGGRRCGHSSGCSKWAQRNGMCMAHSEGKYGNSYRGRQHRMEKHTTIVQ